MFRRKGTIVEWNDDRGFGFIAPQKGGERVFCHIKSFRNLAQRPARGQVFTYRLAKDLGGRSRARDIHPAVGVVQAPESMAPQDPAGATHRVAAYAGSLVLLLALTALVYLQRLPWLVFPWYLGLSLVTFVAYNRDNVGTSLNALALAGGWPGGWIALEGLRHPTQQASFRSAFWLATALNVLVLGAMAYGGPAAWDTYVPGTQQRAVKGP